MHGYQRLCMVINGYVWLSLVMYGYVWLSLVIYGYVKVIQRGGGIYGIYHTSGRRPEVDKAIDTDTELYNQLLPCTKINN